MRSLPCLPSCGCLSIPSQVAQGDHRRHRCGGGLVALVLAGALEPRAVKRLLLVVTGEDAETDRYASPDADISQTHRGRLADVVEMWRAAPDHDAKSDQCVMGSRQGGTGLS